MASTDGASVDPAAGGRQYQYDTVLISSSTLLDRSLPALRSLASLAGVAAPLARSRLVVSLSPHRFGLKYDSSTLCEVIDDVYQAAGENAHPLLDVQVRLNETLEVRGPQCVLVGAMGLMDGHEVDLLLPVTTPVHHAGHHSSPLPHYDHVLFAGTFDHLHVGHRAVITRSLLMARKTLRLALVAGELLQHKRLAKALQPFHVREREVLQFVQDIRPTDWHCDVVIIPDITRDPIGPARTLRDFDCLVVTTETAKGGVVVNEARKEAGCPEVAIVEVALRSQGSQHGGKVSSTDVREYMSDKAGGEEALNAMYDKWSQLIAKACAVDGVVDDDKHEQLQLKIDEWWSTLRDLYLQPWRYYHTLNHVGEILGNIESSCVGEGPLPITVASSAHATTTLQLTAWFHDAIYVPGLDGNEDASQQLWLKFCLDAAVASELRDEVSDIILATKDHVSSRSIYPEEAYPTLNAFLDLDLLILAADEDRYREYAEGIRQEYEPVVGGSSIYAQQRCGFLASVCNSKRAMFAFCGGPSEAQARSNMEMELKRLQLQ